MHQVSIAFFVLLLFKTGMEVVLDALNRVKVTSCAGSVPAAYRDFIDSETYHKSVSYTLTKNRFSLLETLYDASLLAIIVGSGLLAWLYQLVNGYLGSSLWAQGLTLILIGIVVSLPSIPIEWWAQFRIEARFGFNRSTVKLWISDKLKGLVVSFALGYPLICLLLWIVNLPYWWFWAFAAVLIFQVVMMVLYPMFIMPLFNKFEPLPEGDLHDRLMALANRTGFKAKTILVMDGSKRSTHSNAFFTGFGRFRRIVLFDTLIEQVNSEELEAVLAHEIGHYKLGHIPKTLGLSAVFTLLAFAAVNYLMQQAWFYEGFRFSADGGLAPALLLFALLSGLVTFWLTPLLNGWSRKHEYEADSFARNAVGSGEPLIGSLRKLHEKNLSNLTPHPLYSRFYYSHPTLLEREHALADD